MPFSATTLSMSHAPTRIAMAVAFGIFSSSSLAQEAPAPVVQVEILKPIILAESDSYPGRITAQSKVDIVPRVTGFVDEIHFAEGHPVTSGDVLYSINPVEYEAAVKVASASEVAATATVELAKIERDRQKTLFDRGTVAASELQLAEAQLTHAQAQLSSATVTRELAELDLDRTKVVAPISGRMSIGNVGTGALVAADSDVLSTVVAVDPINVSLLVSLGEYTRYLQSGRELSDILVRLELPDKSDYSHEAPVDFAAPRADSTTNSVILRATVPNPDYLLIDQQSVSVTLIEKDPIERLTVPKRAFLLDQIGTYVLVVIEDGTVEVARPELGREFGQRVELLGGLEAGAKIIVGGHAKAGVGQKVTAQEANGG